MRLSRLTWERIAGPGELSISSTFDVLDKADELRVSVPGDSARPSWSRESGFEAPNSSLQGVVSVVLTVEKCEAGGNDGFFSKGIKGTELDSS